MEEPRRIIAQSITRKVIRPPSSSPPASVERKPVSTTVPSKPPLSEPKENGKVSIITKETKPSTPPPMKSPSSSSSHILSMASIVGLSRNPMRSSPLRSTSSLVRSTLSRGYTPPSMFKLDFEPTPPVRKTEERTTTAEPFSKADLILKDSTFSQDLDYLISTDVRKRTPDTAPYDRKHAKECYYLPHDSYSSKVYIMSLSEEGFLKRNTFSRHTGAFYVTDDKKNGEISDQTVFDYITSDYDEWIKDVMTKYGEHIKYLLLLPNTNMLGKRFCPSGFSVILNDKGDTMPLDTLFFQKNNFFKGTACFKIPSEWKNVEGKTCTQIIREGSKTMLADALVDVEFNPLYLCNKYIQHSGDYVGIYAHKDRRKLWSEEVWIFVQCGDALLSNALYEKIQKIFRFGQIEGEDMCEMKDILNLFMWDRLEIDKSERDHHSPDLYTIYDHYLKKRDYVSGTLREILEKLARPPMDEELKHIEPITKMTMNTRSKTMEYEAYYAPESDDENDSSSEHHNNSDKETEFNPSVFIEDEKESKSEEVEEEEEEEETSKFITWKKFFFENRWILYLEELCRQTRLEILCEILRVIFKIEKTVKDIYTESTYLDTISTSFRTNTRTNSGIYASGCCATSDVFDPIIYNETPIKGPFIIKGPPETYSSIGDSWRPHIRSQNVIPCCSGRAENVQPLLSLDETASQYYSRIYVLDPSDSAVERRVYYSICPSNIVWMGCYDGIKYTTKTGKRFHPRVSRTVYKLAGEREEEIIRRIRDDSSCKIGEFEPYAVRIAPPYVASVIESAFFL